MKTLSVIIIILMVLSIVGISYAQSSNISPKTAENVGKGDAVQQKVSAKIDRGLKNLIFGWTDIPKSIIQVTRDSKNPIWGLTGGTLKGIGKAFPRTVSGAADIISFPIADYNKAPIKPDELKTQIK